MHQNIGRRLMMVCLVLLILTWCQSSLWAQWRSKKEDGILDRCEVMLEDGKSKDVVKVLIKYIKNRPNDIKALRLKAEAHQQLKEYDSEKDLLEKAYLIGRDFTMISDVYTEVEMIDNRLKEMDPFRNVLFELQQDFSEDLAKLIKKENKQANYMLSIRYCSESLKVDPLNQDVLALRSEVLEAIKLHSGPGRSIFDGKSLRGWRSASGTWTIENGEIIGDPTKKNLGWRGAVLSYGEKLPPSGKLFVDVALGPDNGAYILPTVRINTYGKYRKTYEFGAYKNIVALWDAKEITQGKEMFESKNYKASDIVSYAKKGKFRTWEIEWSPRQLTLTLNGKKSFTYDLSYEITKVEIELGAKNGRIRFRKLRIED